MGVDTLGPLVLWGASGRRGRHGHNPARAVSALESDPTAGGGRARTDGRASACGVLQTGALLLLGQTRGRKGPAGPDGGGEGSLGAHGLCRRAPPPPPARSNDEMTNLEWILHNSGLPCETQTEITTGKSIDYP